MGQVGLVPGFGMIYIRLRTKQLEIFIMEIFIIIMSNLTILIYIEVRKCLV